MIIRKIREIISVFRERKKIFLSIPIYLNPRPDTLVRTHTKFLRR